MNGGLPELRVEASDVVAGDLRLHFTAGGSLDYAPDNHVQIIRP